MRYDQQVAFGKYSVDFYIADIKTVIEADGIYGHFRKADRIRDADILALGVQHVLHIKTNDKNEAEQQIQEFLKTLEA